MTSSATKMIEILPAALKIVKMYFLTAKMNRILPLVFTFVKI